jgi:hypothetical protein
MLKLIGGVAALAIVGFLTVAAMQPDEFSVTRSETFNAAPEALFPHINNLKAWDAWSPWAKMDPKAKTEFKGPEEGVGASMSWEGEKTGKGVMTITESRPNELIEFNLEFIKPMAATNMSVFTFAPNGSQTVVTWSMEGENNFVGKMISVVMNCEEMVSGQFDQGFANLKSIVEPKSQ